MGALIAWQDLGPGLLKGRWRDMYFTVQSTQLVDGVWFLSLLSAGSPGPDEAGVWERIGEYATAQEAMRAAEEQLPALVRLGALGGGGA